jgi:hypothetical protein
MQQVGGSIGTAVLSTISATVTTNYLASHAANSEVAKVAATHGYVIAFAIAAGLFGVGVVMCGLLFPSKAKLTAMRAAAAEPAKNSTEDQVLGDVVAIEF